MPQGSRHEPFCTVLPEQLSEPITGIQNRGEAMLLAGKGACAGIAFILLTIGTSGPRLTPLPSGASQVTGVAQPNDVVKMQQTLQDKGHYRGKVDGVLGLRTRASVRAYQKAENLPVTGQLDTPTAVKLGLTAEVRDEAGYETTQGKPSAGTLKSAPVGVVDESFARRFWPNQDPIGKRISFADQPKAEDDWMTVVGVTGPIRQENPASRYMTIYQPVAQVQVTFFLQEVSFVVRSNANTASLAPALRAQVWDVDKDLPIRAIASMQDLLYASTAEPRFQTRVLASFSSIAFLLAIVGIYGVMAYSVTQRTQEIGIRMAIGAQRGHIVQMILWRSAALVAGGLAIGLAGAWAATRVLKDFLFEVTPFDPLTFAAVSLLLALVALAACYIPARRAAAIDPLVALRYE